MSNTTVKKQNKLLLAALVLILSAATVLVAITGSANRRKNENPPLDNQSEIVQDDKAGDKTDNKVKEGAIIGSDSADKDSANEAKNETKTDDKTEPAKETTGDAAIKPEDKLEKKPSENPKDSEKTSAEPDEPAEGAIEVSAEPDDVLPEFITPVDGLVLKGASLTVPVLSYTMGDYRTHGGLDFAASPGTPVFAAADGIVTEVTDDPMMGVTVSLSHSGGAVTKYKGLAEDTIGMHNIGDAVGAGEVIGVSGDTALIESAEENHVHFELAVNGETKNPAEYVSVVFLSDVTED